MTDDEMTAQQAEQVLRFLEDTEKKAGRPINSLDEALSYYTACGDKWAAATLKRKRQEADEMMAAVEAHPDWEVLPGGTFRPIGKDIEDDTPEKVIAWYRGQSRN